MYNQIYTYFHTIFSKCQCGFWEVLGVVLSDHSETFDSIDHNLLIAKFNAYGFKKQ